jgi:cell filamentation protein
MDPYVYPGTSVLRNLRDIRDPRTFAEFEAEASARRLRQLEHRPLTGSFDTRHLQAIHHHIFQDMSQRFHVTTLSLKKTIAPLKTPSAS